jgi:DNA-binding NarL/FixJ family response regulator
MRQCVVPESRVPFITVVLGHFGPLTACGLSGILRADKRLRIIETDLDGDVLMSFAARHKPQLAFLDEASVADPSLVKRLKAAQPTIGVVVLACRPTRSFTARLLLAGAAWLSKDAPVAEILAAAHLAASERSTEANAARLTVRETEVLEHLRSGESYGEIAQTLHIGVETVRTHATRVRRKLGVRSRWELIGSPRA